MAITMKMQDEKSTAAYAALNQRVVGLESDVQALRTDLSQGLSNLRSDFITSFNQINNKLDEREDKKWLWAPVVGFLAFIVTVVGGLGTMALLPILKDVAELKSDTTETRKRTWDFVAKHRSEFDYMRGQLDAKWRTERLPIP